jgi:hypothetical protein
VLSAKVPPKTHGDYCGREAAGSKWIRVASSPKPMPAALPAADETCQTPVTHDSIYVMCSGPQRLQHPDFCYKFGESWI